MSFAMRDLQPRIFIIGAPKCGTTSLAEWLSGHPDIWMSDPKEPNFYSDDIPSYRYARSRAEYEAIFSSASPSAMLGEASTTYLRSRNAVPALLEDAPDARLIVCLRNPLEMAQSVHSQLVRSGREPITDFAEAWAAQVRRRAHPEPKRFDHNQAALLYGEMCQLGAQVERLLANVSRDQVHFVFADDMRRSPRAVYQGVLQFIGLEDDRRSNFESLNTHRVPSSVALARWTSWGASISRRVVSRRGLGLGRFVKQFNEVTPVARPELPDSLRAEMAAYFRDDIIRLGELTGRDLGHWLRDELARGQRPEQA